MRKFQLEMGGKNPLSCSTTPISRPRSKCAVNGAYFSTGQRCTASSRLIVTPGIYGRFADALAERMGGLVIDDARKSGVHIGPVVDDGQLEQDLAYVEIGKSEGAKLKLGGERLNRATPGYLHGAGAVRRRRQRDARSPARKSSGPVAAMIPARDYDHALALANDTEFGLCGGICTTSLKYATHFKRNAEVGMAMVNLPTAGRRLSRAVRRPQRLEPRRARAGPLRGRVLHDGQDRLYNGLKDRA